MAFLHCKTACRFNMDHVWSTYRPLLDEVERHIEKGVDSEVAIINQVARYTLQSGGKRLRPLLLLISARLCGEVKPNHLRLAQVIEFIHTATLLHDDVIDNATLRRGVVPARTIWGNKTSILVGDYLYTLAICQSVAMENTQINYALSTACRRMSEGETLQLAHQCHYDMTEDTYLRIIEYKTATLLSASCRLGAIGNTSEEKQEAVARFGLRLGIAYQIADDTLDYVAEDERFGKSLGTDIHEGKVTLPLLHLFENASPSDRERLREITGQRRIYRKDLTYIIEQMKRHHSISYAMQTAQRYTDLAKRELDPFKDSIHCQALLTVSDYVVRRGH